MKPTMKSDAATIRRVVVYSTLAAMANIMPKKNRMATAIAPRIVMIFTSMCC